MDNEDNKKEYNFNEFLKLIMNLKKYYEFDLELIHHEVYSSKVTKCIRCCFPICKKLRRVLVKGSLNPISAEA